jgi:hypothetical protein
MESSAQEDPQPKPRLIVRLGRLLASHHILFRFALLSLFSAKLNPSFSCSPDTLFAILGPARCAVPRASSHSFSSRHLQRTHTSRRMPLYQVHQSSFIHIHYGYQDANSSCYRASGALSVLVCNQRICKDEAVLIFLLMN